MEKFYSKGYVCYLRASQMNDLIEESVYDERKLVILKRVASAYGKIQGEYESKIHTSDNGLKMHLSLFSNEMFITYVQTNESDAGLMQEQLKFVLDEVRQVLSFFQRESCLGGWHIIRQSLSFGKYKYWSSGCQGSSHNEKRRKGSLAG